MMTPDNFAPFVPRIVSRRARSNVLEGAETDVVQPVPQAPVSPEPPVVGPDPSAPAELIGRMGRDAFDDERFSAAVRQRAIKLAGEACARALREAIARNPMFVARFVDDAIEAAGGASCKNVRLSPIDSAACDGHVAVRVVADERIARGEVVVELNNGTVEATLDKRAELLVRAAADP